VVDDEVEDDSHVSSVDFCDERFHVVHGSEGRVDRFEVRDVVAHVDLWGGVGGTEPYYVDAEVADVVEGCDDAGDVAEAVVYWSLCRRMARSGNRRHLSTRLEGGDGMTGGRGIGESGN
jgi:hypothetical protein